MPLYVKTGQFTGTGSGSISTELTFAPKCVMIWGPLAGNTTVFTPRMKTDTMAANDSRGLAIAGNFTDGKITFSGNSFACSSEYNTLNKVYHYLALGGDGCVTGTYTGNAVDNRDITGLGINPDLVITNAGNVVAYFKVSAHGRTTDLCGSFNALANAANYIQQLITDGFQVGTAAGVNADGVVHHYVAIQKSGNAAVFNEGGYTGNATDNRNITGVGFDPSFTAVRSSGQLARVRSVETNDTACTLTASNTAIDHIQAWITDGFQVGTNASVNGSGAAAVWFAFKDNAAPAASGASAMMGLMMLASA